MLAGNPSLGPYAGEVTCCKLGHVVSLNGSAHKIPCDKEHIAKLLEQMFEAKLERHMDGIATRLATSQVMCLAGCAPALLSTQARSAETVRHETRVRVQGWAEQNEFITPLHLALNIRDLDATRKLVTSFAGQGSPFTSPLRDCARWGSEDAAEAMMASKAINAEHVDRIEDGYAASLHIACGN